MKGIFSVKSASGGSFFVLCLCLHVCSFSQVLGYPLRMSFVRADEMESCLCVVEEHRVACVSSLVTMAFFTERGW